MRLPALDEPNNRRRLLDGGSAIRLKRRRKFIRSHVQQLLLGLSASEFDRRPIAIHEHARLRVKQQDRVNAPFKKALEHNPSVLERLFGRTATFVPVTGACW
jgi:hypothetical protein